MKMMTIEVGQCDDESNELVNPVNRLVVKMLLRRDKTKLRLKVLFPNEKSETRNTISGNN